MRLRFSIVLAIAVFIPWCGWAAANDRPPNFVIVLADDLGIGDIGPYGNDIIQTPNLDRMAREGSVLTSFYAAANICTASRGGLLTGRYPARMGLAHRRVEEAGPLAHADRLLGRFIRLIGFQIDVGIDR